MEDADLHFVFVVLVHRRPKVYVSDGLWVIMKRIIYECLVIPCLSSWIEVFTESRESTGIFPSDLPSADLSLSNLRVSAKGSTPNARLFLKRNLARAEIVWILISACGVHNSSSLDLAAWLLCVKFSTLLRDGNFSIRLLEIRLGKYV